MEHRRVGRSGLLVSRLGLGTMSWGESTDAHEAREQLTAYVEAGGTLVDTAPDYADGGAEEVLGQLLGDVVDRSSLVVATKAGYVRRAGTLAVDTSRRGLLAALDGSLERLGTDHVDLWQVQGPPSGTPFEETLDAMDTAVRSGRARYVGVSNHTGWQTARAAAWQQAWPGRALVVSAQVEYSLLQRGVEREVLPAAAALGVGVLAWSPLGRGVLTGKYRGAIPADSRAAADLPYPGFVAAMLTPEADRVVAAVCTAADGLGLAPLEVALAWVRDRPGVASALAGARTTAQLRASLAADEVELPDEIRSALDEISRPPTGYPDSLQDAR
jgi:aryl-alcohol dehydrogenase-like predicted oxidoreductase